MLGHDNLVDDTLVGDHPADAEPGGECLGERAQEDNTSLVGHLIDGGLRLAHKTDLTVGAILDDQHIVLLRHGDNLLPTRLRHRDTGRVLEVGDHVDELRLPPFLDELTQTDIEQICPHTMLVEQNTLGASPVVRQRLQGTEV